MYKNRPYSLDFSDRTPDSFNNAFGQLPDLEYNQHNGSHYLQRNRSERKRLQGLQRTLTNASSNATPRSPRTFKEKFNVWLINEGPRQIFFGSWIFLHLLVLTFGFLNYSLSDNLEDARATFGITYRAFSFIKFLIWYLIPSLPPAIARSAALVLYVDVAFILLPVCRNFISFLRQTPLNDIIPFDKALNFHKATAWAIVAFTVVHVLAHMVNFYRFSIADPSATTARLQFILFLSLNFTTGPGITGWIMTTCLAVIVLFSRDKVRRAHFERFWYSHHLFIVLFINWQLHGMFCMIKPDRPPFCSFNSVGVFWVSYFFPYCLLFFLVLITTNSGIGLSVELSGSLNVSFAKFVPVTSLTSPKWSSIPRMSWNFRSRKKRLLPGPVNIYSFLVLKFLISNGIPSRWPGYLVDMIVVWCSCSSV